MTAIIDVVIVTYNGDDEVLDCLNTILSIPQISTTIIIDNASTISPFEKIKKRFGDNPKFVLLQNDRNVGLAAGNNLALPQLKAPYTLILNPDTLLTEKAIVALLDVMESNCQVGAVGPLQIYEDGVIHSSFHRNWSVLHIIIWHIIPQKIMNDVYRLLKGRFKSGAVAFVSGSCLLTRRDNLLKIGGYDERFFLAVEDVADLCKRITLLDRSIWLVAEAVVTHLGARSSVSVKQLSYLKGCQGHLIYSKKWFGILSQFAIFLVVLGNSVVKYSIFKIVGIIVPSFNKRAAVHSFLLVNYNKSWNWLPNSL